MTSMMPEASTLPSPESQAAQISQLQARIAELEQQNRDQASALAEAQMKLGSSSSAAQLPMAATEAPDFAASSAAPSSEAVTTLAPSASASSASSIPASSSASGPVADCIPGGTRFVGKPGDSFAICKTAVVVKIAAVSDGMATIAGVGPIEAGSFGDIPGKGCSVMVFSADVTGFADLRVTCK